MSEFMKNTIGEDFAPWQTGAAFNAYWTYTYVNNSSFYAMVPSYYRPFMQRYVQNWLWWYDGWVPYFHDQDKGLMSTRVATSLVNRIARKVVGSRLMFKNAGTVKDARGSNASRVFITDWASDHGFKSTVKKACRYAAAAGTALIKLNKSADQELWTEAVRFDRFLPTVDASTGKIKEIKCFLMTTIDEAKDDYAQVYNLVERRYFGDYTNAYGQELKNVPLVQYNIYRASGTVTQGSFTSLGKNEGERIAWKTLPQVVKDSIFQSYGKLFFDMPSVLPFADSLGCELLNWTEGVSGIPQLPFGESLLSTIIPFLMEYDYWASALGTDMYISRGRVLAPEGIEGVSDARGISPSFNAGLDTMLFKKIPYMNPEDQKPIPLQFELRSLEWEKIRNILIESMAVNIGVSPATIAAFLNDSSARTAREVSTEENETAGYVGDTRAIIEEPLNRILRLVQLYYRLDDRVVIKWSQSGLSNPYMMTEMMTSQYNAGLASLRDAISNLNPDDDEDQIELKIEQVKADAEERQTANYDDANYFGGINDNTEIKPTGDSD